ncbi:hypothetical protein [Streptomyces sp. NPDC008125]|uniref:hypothetical protein n=1 Tax=Streptomyces sp. NPDC008125 TaxID=3364811 RepID=UPI0036E14154
MITPPEYDAGYDRCTVAVASLDGGISLMYALTPAQVDAWTDEALREKVGAVKDAVAALLPVGTDIQASISWGRSQSLTVMQESGVVKGAS